MRKFFLFCVVILFAESIIAQSTARTGKDYAVFFYVTTYNDRAWTALPETQADCEKIRDELRDQYGFACELVPNPTKEQIRAKIRAYNNRAYNPDDQVLFFFSMHGHYDPDLDRGFLVARDGKTQDRYGDSWLSYDDLGTDLNRNACHHVMLALDACYSGSFGIRNRTKPDSPNYDQDSDCVERIINAQRYRSRLYFSSGGKTDRTPAKSLFASRWLEALRAGGEGGLLRVHDLEYHLGRIENPQPESGTFKGHEEHGNFVFVRKNACAADQASKKPTDNSAPTLERMKMLEAKVAVASAIKVHNVTVKTAQVTSLGKEKIKSVATDVDKLSICFMTEINEVVAAGEETFYLRIIDPTGAPLAIESLGSGVSTDKKSESEFRYTTTATTYYTNGESQVCGGWQPGQNFLGGKYNVEIYNKGYLVGKGAFNLK